MKKHHLKSKFGKRLRVLSALLLGLMMFQLFLPISVFVSLFFLVGSVLLPFYWKESGVLSMSGTPAPEDESEKAAKLLMEKVEKHLKQRAYMTPEEHEKKFECYIGEFTKTHGIDKLPDVLKDIKEMGEAIKALKEKGAQKSDLEAMTIKGQIRKQLEDQKDAFTRFKDGKDQSFGFDIDFSLQSKAAGVMLESANLGGSAYLPYHEIVPGIVDLARNRPIPIEAYANTTNTSSSRIVWVNKVDPEGQAQFIGENTLKPLVDFNFQTENSNAKKIAAVTKVSTEMLEDLDFMAGEIEGELRYQVEIEKDRQLVSGTDTPTTGTGLAGITSYAAAYVLTTVETTNANRMDAIKAAATQIRTLNFRPTHVFINTIDEANMELTKDGEGRYLIPPFQNADGSRVAGLIVVVSNEVAQGSVLVADMSRYKIRKYKGFRITYGWENQDFRLNLVTVIGEERLHAYASDNETGAFLYDTFDNIRTAITLP